jgi:hypothetical protein
LNTILDGATFGEVVVGDKIVAYGNNQQDASARKVVLDGDEKVLVPAPIEEPSPDSSADESEDEPNANAEKIAELEKKIQNLQRQFDNYSYQINLNGADFYDQRDDAQKEISNLKRERDALAGAAVGSVAPNANGAVGIPVASPMALVAAMPLGRHKRMHQAFARVMLKHASAIASRLMPVPMKKLMPKPAAVPVAPAVSLLSSAPAVPVMLVGADAEEKKPFSLEMGSLFSGEVPIVPEGMSR